MHHLRNLVYMVAWDCCKYHAIRSKDGKTPLQAMKDWHNLKPELFKKQPYYLPECDNYDKANFRINWPSTSGGWVQFESGPYN